MCARGIGEGWGGRGVPQGGEVCQLAVRLGREHVSTLFTERVTELGLHPLHRLLQQYLAVLALGAALVNRLSELKFDRA
jgi:hypothetical protein